MKAFAERLLGIIPMNYPDGPVLPGEKHGDIAADIIESVLNPKGAKRLDIKSFRRFDAENIHYRIGGFGCDVELGIVAGEVITLRITKGVKNIEGRERYYPRYGRLSALVVLGGGENKIKVFDARWKNSDFTSRRWAVQADGTPRLYLTQTCVIDRIINYDSNALTVRRGGEEPMVTLDVVPEIPLSQSVRFSELFGLEGKRFPRGYTSVTALARNDCHRWLELGMLYRDNSCVPSRLGVNGADNVPSDFALNTVGFSTLIQRLKGNVPLAEFLKGPGRILGDDSPDEDTRMHQAGAMMGLQGLIKEYSGRLGGDNSLLQAARRISEEHGDQIQTGDIKLL